MGHLSAQKTHGATSRSLWVLSPCVLTRGIILMNMNSSSSSAIRLLAQQSMKRDLSQETRELIDLKALVAVTKAIDFSAIAELQLAQEGSTRVEPIESLRTADLYPAILRDVELVGYNMPTPIQRYCIPATILWQESVRGLS
ncbi:hypothetical protein QR685DRAFT_571622 [Neurospora intermedia]|uniref:DEAD-box RNA helicase Q domain-containing protein n=1 Tax=Neurospora intermedia TaxID=5142 RepID=A0ABR3DD27_NEUIN